MIVKSLIDKRFYEPMCGGLILKRFKEIRLRSLFMYGCSSFFSCLSLAFSDVAPIQITINGKVIEAELNNTLMAKQLLQRLPMTVTFGEHPNGGNFPTKVTHLNSALDIEGTTLGSLPSGNLGLYYGQLECWNGAVVLGKFYETSKLIENLEAPSVQPSSC